MRTSFYDFCVKQGHRALLAQWDEVRNAPLAPRDVSYGSHQMVWWQCSEGHSWQAKVYSHSEGSGCPYCTGRKEVPENSLAVQVPSLEAEWDAEKNAPLKFADLTIGSHQKVWWRCPICAGQKVAQGENDFASQYPQLAGQWDRKKNDALTPETVTSNSNRRVWWRCEKGHSYQATVIHRVRSGSGCPYCVNRKVLPGFNDLATKEPVLALQWHPTLNSSLTPQQVTPGSSRKVWWQCENGHAWRSVISSRTGKKRCGCPICAGWPLNRCTALLNEHLSKALEGGAKP